MSKASGRVVLSTPRIFVVFEVEFINDFMDIVPNKL
jgi:hypothetical protein